MTEARLAGRKDDFSQRQRSEPFPLTCFLLTLYQDKVRVSINASPNIDSLFLKKRGMQHRRQRVTQWPADNGKGAFTHTMFNFSASHSFTKDCLDTPRSLAF